MGRLCSEGVEYLSTGIPYLDEILGGRGFFVRDRSSPSVMIAGQAGCGKSTLALQIAGACVRRSRSSLVVNLEEDPSDSDFLTRAFNFKTSVAKSIYDRSDSNPIALEDVPEKLPLMWFSYFPDAPLKALSNQDLTGDLSSLLGLLEKKVSFFKELASSRNTPQLQSIVIDSLPVFPKKSNGYSMHRSMFKSLCEFGTLHNVLMILVTERHHREEWLDFVADVVLELTSEHDEIAGQLRYLRPIKTRNQASWEGKHVFRIVDGEGVRVFPNIRETIRHLAAKTLPSSVKPIPFSSDLGLNSFLARAQKVAGKMSVTDLPMYFSEVVDSDAIGCNIFSGESVLLFGEDETRKNVVATRFLQAASSIGENGIGLMIACGLQESSARDMLNYYWLRDSVTVGDPNDNLIMKGPHLFEHADEFLWRLRTLIESSDKIVTRVTIVDLAAIPDNQNYIQSIREYLSALGITSLFVRTVARGAKDDQREQFDNVIWSRHLLLPTGESRIGYRVLKYGGKSGNTMRAFELKMPDTNLPLALADSFRFYREAFDGTLQSIPCYLKLYYPAEDLSEYWEREVSHLFSNFTSANDAPKVHPFGRLEADAVCQSLEDIPKGYPLMGTQIINFDEFWGEELGENDRLMQIDTVFGSEWAKIRNRFPDLVWKNVPKDKRTDKECGLPHHIDFGIYTVRTDLLKWCGISIAEYLNPTTKSYDFTWDQIVNICINFKQHLASFYTSEGRFACNGQVNKETRRVESNGESLVLPEKLPTLPLFDCKANAIDESFLCFVLEILWPFFANFDIRRGSVFATSEIQEALKKLYSNLRSLGSIPISDSSQLHNSEDNTTIFPLFQRHWFVSHWSYMRHHKLLGRVTVIEPPTIQIGERKERARSIRGDWYLGVIKGSPDTYRAAQVLKTVTSEIACRDLQAAEIGIPPISLFHSTQKNTMLGTDRFMRLYDGTVSRTSIPSYQKVRTGMIARLREIFGLVDSDEKFSIIEQQIVLSTRSIDDLLLAAVR